ncbi:CynX/NimT family MFS transporter [Actinophytocola algeriensis]|uniref:CP family cyanate transporter-like MFS transporter n=1 Tax=Actinophytocola algeriensis TaxID=1768010 RepID=A0A7W7Q2R9_9PSEU|nr:MFS transporter [Actinophytocola algeriensis]MBB4905858.1 CP family cyanate transporter-like MFS transporter [Actinophytocola algeriensis]MBE1472457.1 CP family cyanate transporter-like MFS transporter [Actinophytocola algeriensis]
MPVKPQLERSRVAAPVAVTGGALLAVAVVLAALNLRPAVTSVGPLLDRAQADLGATATWAGLLTTMPGLCFAVAGLAAPALARRVGIGAAVALALGVLAVGLVVRVLDGPLVVLGGTLVASAGIALANVLIPVVVKDNFPARVGLMTGVYTAALQGGAAFGSAATPPMDDLLGGWRAAWAGWAVLAVAALVVWLLVLRRLRGGAGTARQERGRSLLRSPLAWIVTVFFGLQAYVAYIVMGWFPQVLMDAGVSRSDAGLLQGLMSLLAVPISLVVPAIAARQGSQTWWIVGLGAIGVVGTVGLTVAPSAAPLLWAILVGVGMSVFSLALTTVALRARDGADTASLSGMAQGFGYLIAAPGPLLFGLLHDLTAAWTIPLVMVTVVMVGQSVFGGLAGRNRYV